MRSRASRIIVTLALLTCLICPLLETLDTWDHTIQTGNDIEYGLVVLALCVGVAYSFARFVFRVPLLKSAADLVSNLCAANFLPFILRCSFFVSPIPLSPSPPALRI
jgi:hypothetical protein